MTPSRPLAPARPTRSARARLLPLVSTLLAASVMLVGCEQTPNPDAPDEPQGALADMRAPDGALPSAVPEADMGLPEIPTVEDPEERCQPGDARCFDPIVAQVCLRDGTWADLPCDQGEGCVDGADRCLPVECVPGKTRCDGRWAQQACSGDGRAWSLAAGCSLDEQCVGGACRVCAPNSAECTGAVTRRRCNNDGTAWLPDEVCDTNLCLLGECLVCVPGEGQCVDDETVRRCRADGMGLEPEAERCADGGACRNGRCRPRCSTSVLVVVDDSAPMAPYLDLVQRILDEMIGTGRYDLAFMSARAPMGCGNGVQPPEVPFGEVPETGRDWLTTLRGDGLSQITDLATWLLQNEEQVWGGDSQPHLLVLTAGGDACGPQGNPGRVSWNRQTYESLGGQMRRSALAIDIVDVGGAMDPQLNQLRICNGRGPAITQPDTDEIEDELRALVQGLLDEAALCVAE